MPVHFALRMLLAFSQPVNCIFWPIETLNWLLAAVNCMNIGGHVTLLSDATVDSLYNVFLLKGKNFKHAPPP